MQPKHAVAEKGNKIVYLTLQLNNNIFIYLQNHLMFMQPKHAVAEKGNKIV
jgi:hypothetical protein